MNKTLMILAILLQFSLQHAMNTHLHIVNQVVNQAQEGDARAMFFLIAKERSNAKQSTTNVEICTMHIRKALHWYICYCIRAHQDARCCLDPEIIANVKGHLAAHDDLQNLVSDHEYNTILKKAIEWIEGKTNNNKLPEPGWVASNQWNIYNETPQHLFLDKEQWLVKRQEVVEEFKKRIREKV